MDKELGNGGKARYVYLNYFCFKKKYIIRCNAQDRYDSVVYIG
jgi:hypothetical protein